MQNLPHRRGNDAGVKAGSHPVPAMSRPADGTEGQTPSSELDTSREDPLSDYPFTPSDRSSSSSSCDRTPTASSLLQDMQARLSGPVSGVDEWKTYQMTSSEWDILQRLLDSRGG